MDKGIPKIPTYGELESKLKDLENENKLLSRRYGDLCKIIRKQGKDSVNALSILDYWS